MIRMESLNAYGQPVGWDIDVALPRPHPEHVTLEGRHVIVAPMVMEHAEGLFGRVGKADRAILWTYMTVGPFADFGSFYRWMETACDSRDPLFFTLIDRATGEPQGMAAYLRIAPEAGVMEIGHIVFSKKLQGTTAATEAMALMMAHAFDGLGYRRYEWKCDALNAPSRAAAERLGFVHEGVFRQATVYKGRNRDTAWFSVTDEEWPALKDGFAAWLDPGNFDTVTGRQWRSLRACRAG